jgi:preprotein translocase subunit SecG
LHSTPANAAPTLAVFCLSLVFEGKSAALIHFQSSSKKTAALLRHQTIRNLLVRSVVIYVAIFVAVVLTVMLRRV